MAKPTPHTNFLAANWRELVFTIVGIVAFWFVVTRALQWVEPTAGTTDFGMVDTLLFATAALLWGHFTVWIIFRVAMKTFQQYLDSKKFRLEWNDARVEYRLSATLVMIAFELWAWIALIRVVAGAK